MMLPHKIYLCHNEAAAKYAEYKTMSYPVYLPLEQVGHNTPDLEPC